MPLRHPKTVVNPSGLCCGQTIREPLQECRQELEVNNSHAFCFAHDLYECVTEDDQRSVLGSLISHFARISRAAKHSAHACFRKSLMAPRSACLACLRVTFPFFSSHLMPSRKRPPTTKVPSSRNLRFDRRNQIPGACSDALHKAEDCLCAPKYRPPRGTLIDDEYA